MRRILLLLVMLVFVGVASAIDYYVATWGDNSTQGNITHPWQNVSYATQQAVAGDTVHLFNGTWYGELCTFANSGNATHPITITAYNGTPLLNGTNRTGKAFDVGSHDYINISGISICYYKYGIYSYYGTDLNITNCTIYDGGLKEYGHDGIYVRDSHNMTIDDCSIYSYFGGGIYCERSSNLKITNNYIFECVTYYAGHAGIFLQSDMHHCLVDNNTVLNLTNPDGTGGNGIWLGTWDSSTNNTYNVISNNICGYSGHNGIDLSGNEQHNIIKNNRIYYPEHNNGILAHDGVNSSNNTIINNTIYGAGGVGIWVADLNNVRIEENIIHDCGHGIYLYHDNMPSQPWISDNHTVIRNTIYSILNNGVTFIESSNNIIEDNNVSASYGDYCIYVNSTNNTIRDLPVGSSDLIRVRSTDNVELTVEFTDGRIFTENAAEDGKWYPQGSNVSFGNAVESVTLTSYNETLVPTNPCLYNVTVSHESDSSDDRTNITMNSTVVTNPTWINATMQNASANYSISVDGSIVDYIIADSSGVVRYHYTGSWSPHDFEFNWVGQGDFSPDHTKAYYNLNSSIENTVNSTGYHFYNKTLGWNDTETTSFKLVVKTS